MIKRPIRTLRVIFFASSLISFMGCSKPVDHGYYLHKTIAKDAEEDKADCSSSKKYHRAIFNAALEIYNNNLELLKRKESSYMSDLEKILRLRDDAENGTLNCNSKDYHRAVYQLEQKIIEQQELLK